MTIEVGQKIPDVKLTVMGSDGPAPIQTSEFFSGKKVALFAVPGAFTPTCHEQHLPGFLAAADQLKAKGIDAIACTAVNDIFVLDAWAKARSANDTVAMLADGSADFAKALGLDIDLTPFGMGTRSKRYAMVVDNGAVTYISIEDSPPAHDKSSAEKLLATLT